MWDAVAGRRQHTFEGHEAPVYSVCPHYKENIQVNRFATWELSCFCVVFCIIKETNATLTLGMGMGCVGLKPQPNAKE